MANIRIPQYERKVQLNANQTAAHSMPAPLAMPDFAGNAANQAASALETVGKSFYKIAEKKQAEEEKRRKREEARIQAERDSKVLELLTKAANGTVSEKDGNLVYSYGRTEFEKEISEIDRQLKEQHGDYFSQWKDSPAGIISNSKLNESFNKVLEKKQYDHRLAALDSTLESKINNVFLTGEDVSGENFNQDINVIVDSYKDTLSERDLQNTRNRAAGRAYALYVDKTINGGNQKDVEALIGRLKAHKDGIPKNFKYMQAEDRAKYIELLERNVKARKDTLFESNAELFLDKFNAAIESGEEIEVPFTDAEGGTVYKKDMRQIPPGVISGNIAGMTGKEIFEGGRIPVKTKMSRAAAMLDYAVKHRSTFAKENNISPKQINSIISYMRQAINDSPVGMKAITDFEAFKVKYNEAYDGGDKTPMIQWGSLYTTLLTADEQGWTADKGMRDKVYQMKTAIELKAARLVKDDEVKSEYKKGWYNFFGTKTNDEYVKDNVENWIRTVANYAYDEAIPAELTGQAYLWAYSYMSKAGWSADARAGAEEKEALSKAVVDYLRKQVRAEYPAMPENATLNMAVYKEKR